MARLPRLNLPGIPQHVVQRGGIIGKSAFLQINKTHDNEQPNQWVRDVELC
jgi:hypothetical protein